MKTLPAREFVTKYVSGYGETWSETFVELTKEQPCAKHMAEFIDDVEMYGQQNPVYVDEDGCVTEGNKLVLANYIMDRDVDFVLADPPEPDESQLVVLEFDVEYGSIKYLMTHISEFLSFRIDNEWVYPLDGGAQDNEVFVIMYCEPGISAAASLAYAVTERLEKLAGVGIIGLSVDEVEVVDDEASEW